MTDINKLIKQAHSDITKNNKEYAPNVHDIQEQINKILHEKNN